MLYVSLNKTPYQLFSTGSTHKTENRLDMTEKSLTRGAKPKQHDLDYAWDEEIITWAKPRYQAYCLV